MTRLKLTNRRIGGWRLWGDAFGQKDITGQVWELQVLSFAKSGRLLKEAALPLHLKLEQLRRFSGGQHVGELG